ncbi:tyrosine-type recombinase/integrase [Kribbella sp. NPDC051936]|uniref:tyrosine-type recombinase/integrase n=1 Tax=Kribbella sp. NPDC051936 TaxID=3154946 RepID=UPI00342D833C
MAFAKDQWTKSVKQADGSVKRERNEKRWGRGKRWLGVWSDPHGSERSKAFDTKVQALRHATSMETDRDRGDYLDPNAGKVRLDDVGERWLGSRTVDPSSEMQYESKWRLHVQPTFGRRMVKSILPSEIAVWLTDLGTTYGASTARGAFLVLNGCLELAVADELIKRNPAKSRIVKRPALPKSRVEVWSDETVDRIIAAHPQEYQLVPITGSAAGLRQGEIFGLSSDDLDFGEKVIRVRRQIKRLRRQYVYARPKNDTERVVPMSPLYARLAQEHIERFGTTTVPLPWERPDGEIQEVELLFIWRDGRPLRPRAFDEAVWKPALSASSVIPPPTRDSQGRRLYKTDGKKGLHALRHYYASVTLADGVNVKELSEYLGHHDPGFTLEQYTHLLPSSHERARQAVDRRLARLATRLTEQRRSSDRLATDQADLDNGLDLL